MSARGRSVPRRTPPVRSTRMQSACALLAGALSAWALAASLPSASAAASAAASASEARAEPSEVGYSAASLYNLANAYARDGKPGLAVLNYERAGLLAPGDPDIAANLHAVRAAAHVSAETPSGILRVVGAVDPEWCAWLGVLGLIIASGSVLGARRPLRRAGLCVGLMLLAIPAADAIVLWPTLHSAVVLRSDTPVRAAPAPMGDSLFALNEADTVRVRAEHDEFVLIQAGHGRTGWVSRASLGFVVPRP